MTTSSYFIWDIYQLENKTPSNIYVYISVWICKNMATEISLIYPLTESCSGAFFLQLLCIYLIGTGKATVDRLWWFSHWLLTYCPAPPPPQKNCFSELPIILSVCQFEIGARIRLNSALIVGCPFLAALSKVFRKASISLIKEQFSRLAKSAVSNIFWYFVWKIGYCELCCWQ